MIEQPHLHHFRLEDLIIPEPCPKAWDAMRGNAEKRYCEHCEKHVHNLSEIPRHRAQALVAHRESPCVTFLRDGKGNVITNEGPWVVRLMRRRWRRVAAALAAILGATVATGSGCVTGRTTGAPRPAESDSRRPVSEGSPSGTATSPSVGAANGLATSQPTQPPAANQSSPGTCRVK